MSKFIEGGESKYGLGTIKESLKSRLERRDARRMTKSAGRIKTNLYKTNQRAVETTDGRGTRFTAEVHPAHPAWGEDVSAKIELPPGRWSQKEVHIQLGWDYYTHRMTDLTVDCQTHVGENVAETVSFRILDGVIDPESTMSSGVACEYLNSLDSAIRQEAVASYYRNDLFNVRFE